MRRKIQDIPRVFLCLPAEMEKLAFGNVQKPFGNAQKPFGNVILAVWKFLIFGKKLIEIQNFDADSTGAAGYDK